MNTATELVATVLQDRRRAADHDRLARFAARVRACCTTSIVDRLAHALRPATYPIMGNRS